MKILLITLGSVCVVLGIIGIILPLVPTTPFLLLAAACYAKSSDKFYRRLLEHKWLGKYIRDFRSKEGVPRATKIKAIAVLWLTMMISGIAVYDKSYGLVILSCCGVMITIFLISLPEAKK